MQPATSVFYCDFTLKDGWAERPSFRSARRARYDPAYFRGRIDQVERLKNFFVYGTGGTILVSGHRGVGKTATVDLALIRAAQAIEEEAATRHTNLVSAMKDPRDKVAAMGGRRPPKELIVLKLDFGQIANLKIESATPPPADAADDAAPQAHAASASEIDPRQVLIEIIKGLHHQLIQERRLPASERRTVKEWAELEALARAARESTGTRWRTLRREARSRLFGIRRACREHWLRAQLTLLRQRRFWRDISALLNQAMVRGYSQSYKEEYSHALTRELTREQTGSWSIDWKKLLPLVGLVLAATGGAWLNLPQLADVRVYAAVAVGGIALSTVTSIKRTLKTSDAVNLVYSRDGSLASLKRDVEDILSRLHEERAPRDFRVVVILDELDKLKNDAMLDRIVESFKNLFTLNRCVFVFITDKAYYDYVLGQQHEAAEQKSYAPQHTFFTQKVFLPRSDFSEIKSYLDSIRVSDLGSVAEQRQWDELVRHLAFVSRGHFFDLLSMLNELVQTSQDRVPRLRLTRERLSLLEFQQRARFQRMVELVYEQEHYPGHLQDHLNNRLLSELYAFFDNLEFASFAQSTNGADGQASLDDQRLQAAQRQLMRLLQKSEAVSPVQVDGHARLDWAPGLCREPVAAMMKLDDRQSELIAELEGHLERWRNVLDGI